MSESRRHDLNTTDQREPAELAEQTHPGPTYSPAVDILETEGSLTLLADMPGVRAEDVKVDLREGVLTLTGVARPPETEAETEILREYDTGTYYRRFALSDAIDQSKITAKLVDGVLHLELPKAEIAKPRQITIQTE